MDVLELFIVTTIVSFFFTVYLSKYRVYWSHDRSLGYHVLPEFSSIAYRCLDDLGRTPIKLVLSPNKIAPWMRIQ